MWGAFFYGLGTGVLLSSMLGTVFFSLIQSSIDHGVRSTMYISVGVILSDILLILLTYFNADLLPENGTTEMVVRIIGAGVLLAMGLSNLSRKVKISFPQTSARNKLLMAGKGFTLNFFNPGNFISWLSISTLLAHTLKYSVTERWAFYIGALLAIFMAEVLIAYGARFLKRFINDKFLHYLNLTLGLVFIVFSLVLLVPIFRHWLQ